MRPVFPHGSHIGSHIARKRGIYHYRRRLPVPYSGEVTLSLKTRRFREAEHLAAILDVGFGRAWDYSLMSTDGTAGRQDKVKAILLEYLKDELERNLSTTSGPSGAVPYACCPATVLDAYLADLRDALADRRFHNVDTAVDRLVDQHRLTPDERYRLAIGVLEADIAVIEEVARHIRGGVPLVLPTDALRSSAPEPATPVPSAAHSPEKPVDQKPLASSLVEPFLLRREKVDKTRHQVIGQERGTLRRFLEACGDRPVDTYNRGMITAFLDTLRRLPNVYGRSPKDKGRSLTDIIAEADATNAERLTDKTVKRHLTALSQFFQFAVDEGHLTVAARTEMVEGHRFRGEGPSREQRDAWAPEDLQALFRSPLWTGSHPTIRSRPGPEIIRDAKFWLPILALYHGARLEEFADLYRRDVGCEDGVWFLRITEETRTLKTRNARRVIPLHPEVIRIGFLDYITRIAPEQDDPLFPDIEPQGKDRKRGPRFTRFFVNYRQKTGLFRDGVAAHAFRHTANTRLRDAISDFQQERHVAYLFGHSQGGGEGRERYDKGPGLKAVAETLALLRYPELDFTHLYPSSGSASADVVPPQSGT